MRYLLFVLMLALPSFGDVIHDSLATQKPLLFGFFAVWCPACNLYRERVLPDPAFKALSDRFVVSFVDVDDPASYALKAHFHIAGYPTLIVAKAHSNSIEGLEEVGRVVGYRDLEPLLAFLESTFSSSDALNVAKARVQQCLDSADSSCAQYTAGLYATLFPNEPYFALVSARKEAEIDPSLLFKYHPLITELLQNPRAQSSATLNALQDLLVTNASSFSPRTLRKLEGVYDALQAREDPSSHAVAGIDMANADLDWCRIDWANALNDPALTAQMRAQGLARMRQLLALPGQSDSKALNIEYADMLGDNGEFEDARSVYRRMIALHPHDFTFYFGAAKNELKAHDGAAAKVFNDQALKYAYGDNLIRVAERQVRVLIAMGRPDEAAAFGREFLQQHPKVAMQVRTNRYLNKVASAVAEANAAMPNAPR